MRIILVLKRLHENQLSSITTRLRTTALYIFLKVVCVFQPQTEFYYRILIAQCPTGTDNVRVQSTEQFARLKTKSVRRFLETDLLNLAQLRLTFLRPSLQVLHLERTVLHEHTKLLKMKQQEDAGFWEKHISIT